MWQVIMILVPLQVFANIATVVLDESSPATKGWFTWRDIFHLLDIICCCAILFPIVWSIKHLRDAAQTDGKVRRPRPRRCPPLYKRRRRLLVLHCACALDPMWRWPVQIARALGVSLCRFPPAHMPTHRPTFFNPADGARLGVCGIRARATW